MHFRAGGLALSRCFNSVKHRLARRQDKQGRKNDRSEPDVSVECLVRGGVEPRSGEPRAVGANGLQQAYGAVAKGRPKHRGAARRVLAPPAAAVEGMARRRRDRVPLSRAQVRRHRPMHPHPLAGQDDSVGARACLPGRRETPVRLDLAGRSRPGGPCPDPRSALERRPRMGRRRQDHVRQVRLPPVRRQPDGPDPRILRACDEHRQSACRGNADGDGPGRPHRDLDAVDGGHRRAPGYWA